MVVEWKRVKVWPGLLNRFLEKDGEIWTSELARQDGFLGKEVWQGADSGEIVLVVRWESRVCWKGIPRERLDEIEERFRRELPEGHEILETRGYEVLER